NIRVVAEKAWHALFARCLFLRPTPDELPNYRPDWTVISAADLHADPGRDGTRSEVVIVCHFARRVVLIAGTHYAGEIKKAIFSVLNYLLPNQGVFPMHRAAYPVEFIPHCELSGRGGHPANIFFLTCDAFGVLPPIARLNAEQAMYHFLSGYTAKVAGTEAGVTEPQATFSACFAAPFLPL